MIASRVLDLYRFLQEHRALFDAHSVDFFLHNHWLSVIPEEWRCVASLGQDLPPDAAFLSPRECSNAGTVARPKLHRVCLTVPLTACVLAVFQSKHSSECTPTRVALSSDAKCSAHISPHISNGGNVQLKHLNSNIASLAYSKLNHMMLYYIFIPQ